MFSIFLVHLLISFVYSEKFNLDVLMPNVAPKAKDTYLCYQFKLDAEKPIYITEFIPNSKKEIAHHMLLFGCDEPGSSHKVWNCGEMSSKSKGEYESAPVCRGMTQSIIYAWALDAPKLTLPEDVAFKLGGNTKNRYVVLQVHYANVQKFIDGETDASGITMVAQHEAVTKVAGVYLLETGGSIKNQSKEYFETACQLDEDVVLHPFAYRTHAHKLGIVNSGYKVSIDDNTGEQKWDEIGRRSPQLPQMFYPATNELEIKKGDIIAARCTMYNNLQHTVHIGSTGDDEMCNFYMMYYVDGDKILDNNICMSSGPPYWYFENFEARDGTKLNLDNIPENASEAPISNEKPHTMQHDSQEMNMSSDEKPSQHLESNENGESEEENDEDINELVRLEEDLLYQKLFKKYFKKFYKL